MKTSSPRPLLVKKQLAASLREAVLLGRLFPGQRVVEATWAREFGVAQASVREAINALTTEGFLVKHAGRSARVVQYSEEDVRRIYEVREALEAQAARLAVAANADLSDVQAALTRMSAALTGSDRSEWINADLSFHLAIADASGNALLADMIRRMLVPLFAFVMLRVTDGNDAWRHDLPRHERILELMREGDPEVAALYIQRSIRLFSANAYQVWAQSPTGARRRRRRTA